MLAVSTSALPIIRRMIGAAPDPTQAGLRIADSPDEDALSLAVTTTFVPGDIVMHLPGTRVFIDPAVADLLDRKELIGIPRDGDIELALRDLDDPPPPGLR